LAENHFLFNFFWQSGVKGCLEAPGFEPQTLRFPAYGAVAICVTGISQKQNFPFFLWLYQINNHALTLPEQTFDPQ